jgi:hypothetical protein
MDISKKITNYPDLFASTSLTNPYTQNTGYIALITQEELMFIKAEAQYWAGDINGAYNTTVAATKYNMERYSLHEAEIMSGSLGNNIKNWYNRFFEIKLPGADKFDISDLMQQKYVAMYLQPEQWTDMRRYNYSSPTNGIAYKHPVSGEAIFVYAVKNVHNGKPSQFKQDADNYNAEYNLRRPYNLYEAYWCTSEDYGTNAENSPNAWVNRLNADTETETKYNKGELDRIGYYTTNAQGEKILDYNVLKRRLIWAHNNSDKVICADPTPWK